MIVDPLEGLTVFLTVAEHRSFTRAAETLEVSTTAVSKAIRLLEKRHGVVLFQRTTRNVTLTETGAALHRRLRPAAIDIGNALAGLATFGQRPIGTLRLTVSQPAMKLLIEPMIPEFSRAFPEITLDFSVNEATVSLASNSYDAGIRLGESVEKDMVAIRLTPDLKWSVVGSPSYFSKKSPPKTPDDLREHECLVYRFVKSGQRYRWEFDWNGREVSIDVPSKVVVDDRTTLVRLAANGLGLAYVSQFEAAEELASGRLIPVLEQYIAPSSGFFLYFPTRTQDQPKLRAFIDMLRRKIHK
ncbi:LysR family transcriptional regulator [Lysobacter enzymogenes]|jgi:DNA-binding transcriptional LysR family regulator|uniref:LysR family transcriptional regulator n=1 Tax=Lysobacter enzymogenes TaxID=69 RepID=UPI000897BFF6|nr:LysR family transcriptional regulator [Lysobacter enzymogenes]SDY30851.1 DNA-binding transcriptional regulator, LysR family [Lysobacter enzymogenes]